MDPYSYSHQVDEAFRTIHSGQLTALVTTLHKARQTGATVFTCGNGGSASHASHLAQDLSKGARCGISYIKAICLCDPISYITALANDEGYEYIFSGQLTPLGRPNDVLIAVSGSGNSPNVLGAVCHANTLGMRTWGITGFDGGELINVAHRCIHVQSDNMGIVEAAHSTLFHWLVEALREKVRGSPNATEVWHPGDIR